MKKIALFLLLVSSVALAKDELKISHASVRATAPGQDSAMVSLRITSASDAELIAVSSSLASSAEIHQMRHENGMMKMRPLDKLALPARQAVLLGSGEQHLMLMGLSRPLSVGDVVPLRLSVQFAPQRVVQINTQAKVTPLLTQPEGHKHH